MARRVVFSILTLLALGATWPGGTPDGRARAWSSPPQSAVGARPSLVEQSAAFAIFVRGIRVGTEGLTVARTDTEWVVSGSSRVEPPVNLTLRQAEARYSLDLVPRRLTLVGQLGNDAIDLTTTFEGAAARNAFLRDGRPVETTDQVTPGTVVLSSNYFGGYAVLAAWLARMAPGEQLRVYFAPQGEVVAVLESASVERVQTATRSIPLRRHRVTFRSASAATPVEIETEEDGTFVRLTLPGPQLQIAREDVASVAARQQSFFREGDEDVRITGNGFTLAGTISRPRETVATPPPRAKRPLRRPTLVLVPGAAGTDRDYVTAGIPVYGQLAASLADAGYQVVRYDQRGVGQSGGRVEAVGVGDYADDVVSVVRWLTDRKDVDEDSITLLGYDEGAWVALLAASREKRVARVALVASPGTRGADLVLERQQAALAKMTLADEEKQRRVELQKRIHAALLEGAGWQGVPEEMRKQADNPWFASFLAFDPAKVMEKVRQPVLVLSAALDAELPARHAEALVAAGRARKKDPGVTLVTLPGLDHQLIPVRPGEAGAYPSLQDRTVSPAVAAAIASWIAGR